MNSDAVVAMITAVLISAINMAGSVLILWIRARHRWVNGDKPAGPPAPPTP